MPKLGKSDFIKGGVLNVASGGNFAGKTRVEICYEKIEKELPFTIGDSENGPQVYGVGFAADGKGKPNLNNYPFYLTFTRKKGGKVRDQEQLKITEFLKDTDFGGGGARSKQADNTGPTESGCAYYCSLVFNVVKRKLKLEDCTDKNLKAAAKFVYATSTLKDFQTNGPQDWVDENVYINTANAVYEKFKSKFVKTDVYCHRGSPFMENLYQAFKSAKKLDAKEDSLAPGSFNNDKWNPGDIWLSTFDPRSEPLKECRNFAELKQCVLEYAGADGRKDKTELLAVSLKKPGNPNKALLNEYNTKTRSNYKKGEVTYDGFSFGKTGDFFSSNDVYLYMGGKDVQFRAFNTTTGWQGNIIGTGALGGKIGGGNIDYYLVNSGISSISARPGGEFKETTTGMLKPQDYKLLHQLYMSYFAKQSRKVDPKKFDFIDDFGAFEKMRKSKGNNFAWQKLMGMRLINALETSTRPKRNNVATEIIRYAASNTDISTYFIKVE